MEEIKSRDNERVKFACKLAASAGFRAKEGLFFAEGKRLCTDLAATLVPRTVFVTEDSVEENRQVLSAADECYLVTGQVAQKLSETKTPQGIFCLFSVPVPALEDIDITAGVLLCETLQDPGNAGTIIRTAAAFGLGGVVFSAGSADVYNPKTLRASMGAVARMPVLTGADIIDTTRYLKEKGVVVYAAALTGGTPLDKAKRERPFGLLIGNEGAGLSDEVIKEANKTVYIPMLGGVESLNAGVAASVLLFWLLGCGQ